MATDMWAQSLLRRVLSTTLALGLVVLLAAGTAPPLPAGAQVATAEERVVAATPAGVAAAAGATREAAAAAGATRAAAAAAGATRAAAAMAEAAAASTSRVGVWGLIVAGIVILIIYNYSTQQAKRAAFQSGGDWDGGGRRTVHRRPRGPVRSQRRKREEQVEIAAEEAAMQDAVFTAESVKQAARDLHKAIVEAWTARDRTALAKLVGPDLMVEWNRRLDDFDRKGWHNMTERMSEPGIEYLGLVNREGETEDRVTIRIEATIRDYTVDSTGKRLLRTDDTDEVTTLPEYWTLGRHDDGSWFLVSIEQDAEGGHVLQEDIVARPDADTARLHDEAVADVAVVGAVPDEAVKDIAPLSFDGDARTAALDMANIDGRFDPDVLEASARRAVAAWAEAVDGEDAALEAVATPAAIDELLYDRDTTKRTRLVVRGPVLKTLRIAAIDAHATPPTMTVEAEVTGRRYRENRDTTILVNGSKENETTFTESWTMALDGNDKTPWRLVGSASIG